ncbi:MAG: metallophosphoesterase [Methanobrevibacter sp.]|uniref:metallophosphoesterase family protein n=1 Tax=Methanobrevibacter sp. TaxID=66852 RepID=UPI0026E075CF|nr:metallophosphoesterase [Methanobrevibacter sp.]MDO5848336.1 metallophosphoesterase [Methanobrevibacter sp.]
MLTIAHISDLHVSDSDFNEDVFLEAVDEINALAPDFIILTGDLTNKGYYTQFEKVKQYLELFDAPIFAVPGNHDARNLGDETFEELIGEASWKLADKENKFVVIGLDSSLPDLNEGSIGKPQKLWLDHQLDECVINELFTIVAFHHHIIPIPKTGRERNVLLDAGDILKTLVDHEVDMVLVGHKHVPNVWKMNNTLIINAGSISSKKLRGNDVNSYNIYYIDETTINIVLKKVGKEPISLGQYPKNVY